MVAIGEALFVWMVKPITDRGLVEQDSTFILLAPLAIIAIGLVRAGGNFIDSYCMSWVGGRIVKDLQQLMFARLLRAPTGFYDHATSGMLTSRLTYNVTQVLSASTGALRTMFLDGAKVILLVGLMIYYSWQLSLLFAVIMPIAYGVFKISSKRFRTVSLRLQTRVGAVTQIAKEAFQGHRLVKIFSAYDYQQRIFHNACNRNRQDGMKRATIRAASVSIIVFLSTTAIAGIIWIALQLELSAGVFTSYLVAMTAAARPIRSLAQINLVIQGGLAGAQSVFETIDLAQESDRGKTKLQGIQQGIRFNKVSFRYGNEERPVLDQVSFDIKAGNTVALVGVSGSGKSTIASLLLRFYTPHSGEILVDGKPISRLTLKSLRANTALVSQEVLLLDDSIRNNIAYGEQGEIDQHKLQQAVSAAHVNEFTADLKQGLNTRVGESGMRLSGGQRQRIAIARALYKDAPFLIMDEATSSLDSKSEKHIQTAIARLVKNRTSLIIAHRLSTIENADLIIALENGRIAETGTHAQLLARGGLYADLHRAQHNTQSPSPNPTPTPTPTPRARKKPPTKKARTTTKTKPRPR